MTMPGYDNNIKSKDNKHAIDMIVNRIVSILKSNVDNEVMFLQDFDNYDEFMSLCYTLSLLSNYTDYYESHIYAVDESAEQICRIAYLELQERNILEVEFDDDNLVSGFTLV